MAAIDYEGKIIAALLNAILAGGKVPKHVRVSAEDYLRYHGWRYDELDLQWKLPSKTIY